MTTKTAIFILCALLSGTAIAQERAPLEPLRGLPSGCSNPELRRLEADIRRVAANRDPDQAWLVARTMLCGWSQGERQLIRDHTPATYSRYMLFGTDEETSTKARNEVSPLAGYAYGVSVEASRSGIDVGFTSSAASSGGFLLKFVKRQWLIVRVDESVD